jgi:DNA repair exonuclease SbcCD nuclease subunit
MKIAFTADLHLTTQEDHPERFNALANVLEQCNQLEIEQLFIAGDLFDESRQNFADFEAVVKAHKPDDLQMLIIPGNHDPDITTEAFAVDGLEVFAEPSLITAEENGFQFLLIPYQHGRTMGEAIAPFQDKLSPGAWVLVGHGDWAGGLRSPDPYEKGVYMPLTRADLNDFQPTEVFLGHIHLPYDEARIHYPGSACPMNITETGLRRFLTFDTETQQIEAHIVECDIIYFDERFVLIPVEDEVGYLRQLIADRIAGWGLPDELRDRVRVRIKVSGYVTDRSQIEEAVQEALKDFKFYKDEGPDLSQLNLAFDTDHIFIIRQVQGWLETLDWSSKPPEPSKDEILSEALRLIYGA